MADRHRGRGQRGEQEDDEIRPGQLREEREDHQHGHRDDRPEQPAHAVALHATGAAVPDHDRAIGTAKAAAARPRTQGETAAANPSDMGSVVGSRSRPVGTGVVVDADGRADDRGRCRQAHHAERLVGDAPPAGEEAAGREDQQAPRCSPAGTP